MAESTVDVLASEGTAVPTAESPATYKNPFLWVPSSYLAMGLVYVTVGSVANIMFKNMGLANDEAAFWSSLLGLPYTLKPLWAPLLELSRTKKLVVVLMQLLLAALIAGAAFVLYVMLPQAIHTVPTGFSSVPPSGPAMPETATA